MGDGEGASVSYRRLSDEHLLATAGSLRDELDLGSESNLEPVFIYPTP
jgi:hypothetical protein